MSTCQPNSTINTLHYPFLSKKETIRDSYQTPAARRNRKKLIQGTEKVGFMNVSTDSECRTEIRLVSCSLEKKNCFI